MTRLIFDSFPSPPVAQAFATTVTSSFGLDVQIFDTEAQALAHDACPANPKAPIVCVASAPKQEEQRLRAIVGHFGGSYRGD